MSDSAFTAADLAVCAEHEVRQRQLPYPQWVEAKRITQALADRQTELMQATARKLRADAEAEAAKGDLLGRWAMGECSTTMGLRSRQLLRIVGRSLVQEGNANLVSVAPYHLGSQSDASLRYRQIKAAREESRTSKYKLGPLLGQVSDHAIDSAAVIIEGNLCPEICSAALCLASIKHDRRSRFETYRPINDLFCNLRTVAVDALDTLRAA